MTYNIDITLSTQPGQHMITMKGTLTFFFSNCGTGHLHILLLGVIHVNRPSSPAALYMFPGAVTLGCLFRVI